MANASDIINIAKQAQSGGGFSNPYDTGPKPTYTAPSNFIDPETQLLIKPYQLTDEFDTPYNQVLDQYRQKAELPEDQQSAAAKVLQEQLGLKTTGQLESAKTSSATAAAEARGQQARQGGVSSSIMANLNRLSERDLSRNLQSIRAQSAQQGLGITAQDLQDRQGMLQNLLSQEAQNRTFLQTRQEQNINNALTEQNVQRQIAAQKYQDDMNAWAAGKQAQATAASGGGGKK